jgi:hypothetical protein
MTEKAFINRTDAQMATRAALAAPEHQIAKSAYTHDHIRYMESLNWVLRVQDDRFVYVKIERDGSYNTADIDED